MTDDADRERDDRGRYAESVSDAAILDAVERLEDPTTRDVASAVEITHPGVSKRLHRLLDEGRVQKREVGSAFLWEVVDQTA